jgi:hypothetical protein
VAIPSAPPDALGELLRSQQERGLDLAVARSLEAEGRAVTDSGLEGRMHA